MLWHNISVLESYNKFMGRTSANFPELLSEDENRALSL